MGHAPMMIGIVGRISHVYHRANPCLRSNKSTTSTTDSVVRRHERRKTTYLEMSRGLAQSGIEKWTVDTGRMTMTFYDKAGREMLVEQIS
jgi:uncharacterized protein YbcV (DUF1398 family)